MEIADFVMEEEFKLMSSKHADHVDQLGRFACFENMRRDTIAVAQRHIQVAPDDSKESVDVRTIVKSQNRLTDSQDLESRVYNCRQLYDKYDDNYAC